MTYQYNRAPQPIFRSKPLGRSLATKSTAPQFDSLPWELGNDVYKAAAFLAEETAQQEYRDGVDTRYSAHLARLEVEYQLEYPEGGANEAGFQDSNPHPGYLNCPNLGSVRRRAGQAAFNSQFLELYTLKTHGVQVLAEIITWLAQCKLRRNPNGLVSGLEFCKEHFNTPRQMGIYRFLMHDARSNYLSTQYKLPAREYSALVPLVLYAHKLVHKVAYSQWDPKELHLVVNHNLCEAMLWQPEQMPSTETLLEDREKGLRVNSGKAEGSLRSPTSTHKLYATKGTCFESMPGDAQVMLAQIWVAHPQNRTRYMVLDPVNWDRVPEPLISAEVLATLPEEIESTKEERSSWG